MGEATIFRPGTRVALVSALLTQLTIACGGRGATAPNPAPPPPTPTPAPTPAPTPSINCSPLPPPVTRLTVKVHFKNSDYWTLDATPMVGPDVAYCTLIGFTDGRSICPVRPEGDPMRADCEAYAVGKARDTGRSGPTWTRGGAFCTGRASLCQNSPDNQYQLWAYAGGLYDACAANGACGQLQVDK